MSFEQIIVVLVLLGALVFFAWDRWRYDVVAVVALMVLAFVGIVPASEAFSGFSHPAVITVAAMLVLSRSLETSGIVDLIAHNLASIGERPILILIALTSIVAVLSAFMNNVGALVLMLPIAIQISSRNNVSPSLVLMPLGFASIMGGLMTLIGTPPNIIISSYRATATGQPFGLFDFAPVGIAVVLAGLVVLALLSRPLIKQRGSRRVEDALSQLDPYITEVSIPEDSAFVGARLSEFEDLSHGDCAVVALIRGDQQTLAPRRHRILHAGDFLVLETDPETLQAIIDNPGVELAGERHIPTEELISSEITLTEAVVLPGSLLEQRTAAGIQLHARHSLNLLAISRQGSNFARRIGHVPFKTGDVLLFQGNSEAMPEALSHLGCLPVSDNRLRVERRLALVPLIMFVAALGFSAMGLVAIQISLVAAAALIVLSGHLSLRDVYDSIDWTVIVLLGAMVPVGKSLESTGLTTIIADGLIHAAQGADPFVIVPLLLVSALAISNIVNNAATAILMAPIAVSLGQTLQTGTDAFLMAVAIGSSCAFMTPIGHQSNLLVMGPGGYRFGDYWRLGLPLSIVVVLVAVPMIALIWPLQ